MTNVPHIKDIMTQAAFSFSPDMSAYAATDIMLAKSLAGVPVIDDEDSLVGFLTEKDCLRLLAVAHQYNMTGRKVSDIMSTIKESLHPSMDVLSAAMRFINCNFATLPVMEDNKLVGSISRRDLLQAIQQFHTASGNGIQLSKRNLKLVENPSSIEDLQILVMQSSNAQLASVFGGRHSRNS